MRRHFTVTGFVSHPGGTALHWHRLGMWLPPGGHIEPDEDPIQAVLREVAEETELDVEIIPTVDRLFGYEHPPQLLPPAAMAVYDIPGDRQLAEPHQHIDLIYFARPLADEPRLPEDGHDWAWFDETMLRTEGGTHPLTGRPLHIAEDVRELGIAAIEATRRAMASAG